MRTKRETETDVKVNRDITLNAVIERVHFEPVSSTA